MQTLKCDNCGRDIPIVTKRICGNVRNLFLNYDLCKQCANEISAKLNYELLKVKTMAMAK